MNVADYNDFTMICKVSPPPYLRIMNKIWRNESHFSHLRRADDRIFILVLGGETTDNWYLGSVDKGFGQYSSTLTIHLDYFEARFGS